MGSNDTNGINTFHTSESQNHDIKDLILYLIKKKLKEKRKKKREKFDFTKKE